MVIFSTEPKAVMSYFTISLKCYTKDKSYTIRKWICCFFLTAIPFLLTTSALFSKWYFPIKIFPFSRGWTLWRNFVSAEKNLSSKKSLGKLIMDFNLCCKNSKIDLYCKKKYSKHCLIGNSEYIRQFLRYLLAWKVKYEEELRTMNCIFFHYNWTLETKMNLKNVYH